MCSTYFRQLIYTISITFALNSSLAFAYPGYHSHRSVIYFAPQKDDRVQQFIIGSHRHACELDDRDVVTLIITEDGISIPTWLGDHFSYQQLAESYSIHPGSYTGILIGKDGGEKLRWSEDTDWERIQRLIDAMPMRQREMQNRVNPCAI